MGAAYFEEVGEGITAEKAFRELVMQAQWDYGRAGYTGTIAEKSSFKMAAADRMGINDASKVAEMLSNGAFSDKWGPAGCIGLDDGRWLFFGWASS